jgi:hypothetical protein
MDLCIPPYCTGRLYFFPSSRQQLQSLLMVPTPPLRRYHEFCGGHSDLNWRGGFGNGLLALIGRN